MSVLSLHDSLRRLEQTNGQKDKENATLFDEFAVKDRVVHHGNLSESDRKTEQSCVHHSYSKAFALTTLQTPMDYCDSIRESGTPYTVISCRSHSA